jgi:2-amino-4-hydroxy-6-hydroxymethyldihydropteridine diphosphokinase
MTSVYIALGSNIDPENNLKAAATLLRELWPEARFSSVYLSEPLEHTDQPEFLNAAGAFDTDAPTTDIRERLLKIERELGKNPPFRFGPRTIDLDLLLYGHHVQPDQNEWQDYESRPLESRLIIPHPRMHRRRFVLEPLSELIDMTSAHPVLGVSWRELLQEMSDQKVHRLPIIL